MQLVHEPEAGDATVVASTVELADSFWSHLRGLMFRRSIPDSYALAFRFGRTKTRDVHMLFVPFPIDVLWIVDDVVERVERLRPWFGFARAEADLIVELPAGTADDIEPGDRVRLEAD
ncbi:DUF192 domain-containing protein [Natrarchaeobaculum sulfurireducens]|uniref:DUF192 domain-containing protein n=1 Tax=Natrarchaeobaculum sulfurireducens TaxID=2044521 RepID=A0A346PEN6_9EURY|nr:DUF192 domain-containing protein [Natrarchaeobaculum sulfurireducens]AXR77981.1 hypothetical protein AArc1_1650 [Natrarchaeobaculum sulfurireducens]AXR82024.1 hypothetical protein AArcMg_2024 [Natrarchaeobaculum sulfurireducens]